MLRLLFNPLRGKIMKKISILLTMMLLIVMPLTNAGAATSKEVKQTVAQIKKVNKKIVADAKKDLRASKIALKKANAAVRKAQAAKAKADRRVAKLQAKYPNATPAQQKLIAQAMVKAQQAAVQARLTDAEAKILIEQAIAKAEAASQTLLTATQTAEFIDATEEQKAAILAEARKQSDDVKAAADLIRQQISNGGNLEDILAKANTLLTTTENLRDNSEALRQAANDVVAAELAKAAAEKEAAQQQALIDSLQAKVDSGVPLTAKEQAALDAAQQKLEEANLAKEAAETAKQTAEANKNSAEEAVRQVADLLDDVVTDIGVSPSA
jgi:hypothetical protein